MHYIPRKNVGHTLSDTLVDGTSTLIVRLPNIRPLQVNDWDATNPTEGAGIMAAAGQKAVKTFFERITKDIEIVRVALLLTGCIQVRESGGRSLEERRKDREMGGPRRERKSPTTKDTEACRVP